MNVLGFDLHNIINIHCYYCCYRLRILILINVLILNVILINLKTIVEVNKVAISFILGFIDAVVILLKAAAVPAEATVFVIIKLNITVIAAAKAAFIAGIAFNRSIVFH